MILYFRLLRVKDKMKTRNFLFTFLLVVVSFKLSATHLVGGYLTVDQTAPNTYTIKAVIFRDCCPACTSFPTYVDIGIYDLVNNSPIDTIVISNPLITPVVLGDSCFTPTNICIEEGVFIASGIVIPNNPNGYYLQTELYARNNTIANIVNPGGTGISLYASIPNPALTGMNDTPQFGSYPGNGYFCINTTGYFDFSVTETDGDSLVYSFTNPLSSVQSFNGTSPAPYPNVTWQSPYNLSNIIGGTPPLSINPSNGWITSNASTLGTFVFAVKVEEFRNNQKLGESIVDIQFQSIACDSCLNSIAELSDKNDLIFPNPFSESFTIEAEGYDQIRMYDIDGRLLANEKFYNKSTLFSQHLTSGLYIIELSGVNGTIRKKIIKITD